MHVLVIGAGVSGLCSAKHLFDAGVETTVYEKSNEIGGTWVYTDDIDSPETGVNVHSSMYQNLKTNIAKEISGFPEFPFIEQDDSFVTSMEMLNYLKWYADHYNLKQKIKFEHNVIRVTPYEDTKWEVIVHNIKEDIYINKIFDAVMVCNGNYSSSYIPQIPGQDNFKGKVIHSHNFRHADMFKDQNVLVIGSGPSGFEISVLAARHAKKVTISHRLKNQLKSKKMPSNYFQKPEVKQFTENGAEFSDGTFDSFDAICYCTGFNMVFPFLSVDSELSTDQNFVRPLYKHIININKPTMAFIGLTLYVLPCQTFDLQARFVIKHWLGEKQLPSKQEMLEETIKEEEHRKSLGIKTRHAHLMLNRMEEYVNELATKADTTPVKPVILKLREVIIIRRTIEDFIAFKDDVFRILDDKNFIRITDGVEYLNM